MMLVFAPSNKIIKVSSEKWKEVYQMQNKSHVFKSYQYINLAGI